MNVTISIKNFFIWSRDNWKKTLVWILITFLLTKMFLEPLYNFIMEKYFTKKPKIVVNLQKYNENELNHTIHHNIQLSLITACYQKIVIYNDIISSPLLGRSDANIPFSYSNYDCLFSDNTSCMFYAVQLKNIGDGLANSVFVDIYTSSSKIESTERVSPKIKFSEYIGFFGERAFRFEINSLDVNESAGILLKMNKDIDMNLVCRVNGRSDFCLQNLIDVRSHVIAEGERIEARDMKSGNLIPLDISYIQGSYEPIFYDYDSNSNKFIKQEIKGLEIKCSN